jgi:hypothetical protein
MLDECSADAVSALGWAYGKFGARSLNRVGHVKVGVTRQSIVAVSQEMAPMRISTMVEVEKNVL